MTRGLMLVKSVHGISLLIWTLLVPVNNSWELVNTQSCLGVHLSSQGLFVIEIRYHARLFILPLFAWLPRSCYRSHCSTQRTLVMSCIGTRMLSCRSLRNLLVLRQLSRFMSHRWGNTLPNGIRSNAIPHLISTHLLLVLPFLKQITLNNLFLRHDTILCFVPHSSNRL